MTTYLLYDHNDSIQPYQIVEAYPDHIRPYVWFKLGKDPFDASDTEPISESTITEWLAVDTSWQIACTFQGLPTRADVELAITNLPFTNPELFI